MLKMNPEKDIKELEKFGFKPKYNVSTGKIEKYECQETIDLLYDLIKADMVVKE